MKFNLLELPWLWLRSGRRREGIDELSSQFSFEKGERLKKKEGKWVQDYENIPLKDINDPLPPESDIDEDEDEEASLELNG